MVVMRVMWVGVVVVLVDVLRLDHVLRLHMDVVMDLMVVMVVARDGQIGGLEWSGGLAAVAGGRCRVQDGARREGRRRRLGRRLGGPNERMAVVGAHAEWSARLVMMVVVLVVMMIADEVGQTRDAPRQMIAGGT